ncbi:4-hydroxy-tetrahydrodipicolinate synthase [Chryseolinea lacunae]|uniref:4-hydroxy-tetrahydrodipicolinate synthase n=1 Tax=Chryseolinea lacunae TaxID=2801331 RepID=A0ABS1L1I7_9BACT|nr:4-hydroxy-tetrahydrodipicolinate synthase [Chryseolinea lacunae]MBL0744396.1 4-hydroxy-tetrahydrodipicolinate synthase [Chryseolinea lacunae]
MRKLYGTGVALVTPFTETLEVDYKALKKLLQHTAKGADYYVVMGTTGESVTCSDDEKLKVLNFVKANNPKNLPIVYGIGGNDTRSVVDEIIATDLKGVDALLSVSPYYNKPSQEGIYRHYTAVADASPIPVLLYNVPGRTAANVTAETTLKLAEHKNIVGIKDASGNMEQFLKIAKYMPKDFVLISGDDMWTLGVYAVGGKGVISVLANAFPQSFRKIKDYAFSGNYAKAAVEQARLLEINGPMYEEGNPVGIKYVLSKMGIMNPGVRLPLVPGSGELKAKIDRILAVLNKK